MSDDHGGLHRDLPRLLSRREAIYWLGGMSLAGIIAACGGRSIVTTTTQGTSAPTTSPPTTIAPGTTVGASPPPTTALAATIAAGPEIPDETGGPFPADGTNGPNVLTESGVLKRDITTSFGSLSGTAVGVPLTYDLVVVEADTGDPLPGALVYLWTCTADARYSIYEIADQNYLRGAQIADADGRLSFDAVFPGCYPSRWPHAHFEVFSSLDEASIGSAAIKTSQLALPRDECETAYVDDRYGNSAANLDRLTLEGDIVFRDGFAEQVATVRGSNAAGYVAELVVRI